MHNTSLLAMLQLADSFFPTGMFTHSHGLEAFVGAGAAGAAQIEPLLHTYLRQVVGPGDALATRWVARAATDDLDLVAAVDERLEATRLAKEGRLASRRCGGRLLLLGCDVFGGELLPRYAERVASGQAHGHQAVALALIAAANDLDEESAVLVELHSFSVSLVSAAVRMGALDHAAGQRLLLHAAPVMAEVAEQFADADWQEIGGFAPWVDVMQFRHQHAQMHMFVS